jgi:hypothetical protein
MTIRIVHYDKFTFIGDGRYVSEELNVRVSLNEDYKR